MKLNRTMTMAILCGAALATPALAQDGARRDRRRADGEAPRQPHGECCDGQRQRSSDRAQRGDQRAQRGDQRSQRQGRASRQQGHVPVLEVEGRLVALRTLQHEGESHLLAKIVGTDGEPFVLDLGSVDELRRTGVRLRGGQNLQASGTSGRAAMGERLIVVDRFRADDGPIVIVGVPRNARHGEQGLSVGQRAQHRRSGPRGVLVQGTVAGTRDVDLQGSDDTHRLVKLATPEGRTVVVDLGEADALGDDLTIEQGEQLAIIGRIGRVNGRPVIFATHVADVAMIDREHDRQAHGEDVSQEGRPQRSPRQRERAPRSRTDQQDHILRQQEQQDVDEQRGQGRAGEAQRRHHH